MELRAQQAFQLQQMLDILRHNLVERKVDIGCMENESPVSLLRDPVFGLPLQYINFHD